MNSEHAVTNVVEEIFEEFTVAQHNPEEQFAAYEVYRHKKIIEHHLSEQTQQDIEKARAEWYVLCTNLKTLLTIKAF